VGCVVSGEALRNSRNFKNRGPNFQNRIFAMGNKLNFVEHYPAGLDTLVFFFNFFFIYRLSFSKLYFSSCSVRAAAKS